MESFFGTRVDLKNISLSMVVFDVRQDIDLYVLLSANWKEIERVFGVGGFFPQIRRRVLGGIILGICKIYELEGSRYPLNSINGILKELKKQDAEPLEWTPIEEFGRIYDALTDRSSAVSVLEQSFAKLRETREGFGCI